MYLNGKKLDFSKTTKKIDKKQQQALTVVFKWSIQWTGKYIIVGGNHEDK